jgi:Type II secretion system protein C
MVHFAFVKIERLHLFRLSGPAMFDSVSQLLAAALGLAAMILAGWWLTVLTAPRPVAELPAAVLAAPESSTLTVSRLFGGGSVDALQSQAVAGLHLTGVFAASMGGGFATIHTQRGEVPAFPGDEVAPGVILNKVESDRVIILVSGLQKVLLLHENSAPGAVAPGEVSPDLGHPSMQTGEGPETP